MINGVYSVLDKKAKAYLQPFFLPNSAVAQRAIADCVNDPEHQFSRHAADYVLCCLGSWDNSTGMFSSVDEVPVPIVELVQLVGKE